VVDQCSEPEVKEHLAQIVGIPCEFKAAISDEVRSLDILQNIVFLGVGNHHTHEP